VYRTVKNIADSLIKKVSQSLPQWQHYIVEQTFPSRVSYQPTLPANMTMFAAETSQRFLAPVLFKAHHIYRLHNVHVTWDGAVFHNLRLFLPSIVQARFASRFQDTLLLRQWVSEKINSTVCVAVCHDQWSVENYYHWLIDTLPRLLVLRQTHPDMLLLLPQPLPPKQLPDYITRSATALGFTHYLPVTTKQILRADCVVLSELTAASLTQNPELVTQVQRELIAALQPTPVEATRKVYAARAKNGVRSIVNEVETDELLQGFGFEKVYFEKLSFLEQVQLMRETSVFIGVHGAGMTNILFLQSDAKVIELLNKDDGDLCYFRLASCLNLTYFWAPCTAINQELANQSDMVVNIELLRQTIVAALLHTTK
jgi:hypothetical protein